MAVICPTRTRVMRLYRSSLSSEDSCTSGDGSRGTNISDATARRATSIRIGGA